MSTYDFYELSENENDDSNILASSPIFSFSLTRNIHIHHMKLFHYIYILFELTYIVNYKKHIGLNVSAEKRQALIFFLFSTTTTFKNPCLLAKRNEAE